MRIERINENSISCTLTSFDLSVRNLNIRELAYGSDKARQLFNEMMTKASSEVGFNAENTPIMIEAIPMGSNSIKLIISKVSDPEELDARFSRFTESAQRAGRGGFLDRLTEALLEGVGGLRGLTESAGETVPETESEAAPAAGLSSWRAFSFDTLDEVIRACGDARELNVAGTLYKHPRDGSYVLVVRGEAADGSDFAKACNIIAEFGRMLRTVPNSIYYFDEHFSVILAEDAVRKLGSI